MGLEDIKKRIDDIESAEFYIQMNDHLSRDDYDDLKRLHDEKMKLQALLVKGDE